MKTKIISAFPGTGKTTFFNNYKDTFTILDSDSSTFDKKEFPQNYISHIKENMGKCDYILVSSHEDVRNALVKEEIEHFLVYPKVDCRSIYLDRYKGRGSSLQLIDIIDSNWYDWIKQCDDHCYDNQDFVNGIKIGKNTYLEDIVLEHIK